MVEPYARIFGDELVKRVREFLLIAATFGLDRNAGHRRLGLHRLGYQILTRDGAPAPGDSSVQALSAAFAEDT